MRIGIARIPKLFLEKHQKQINWAIDNRMYCVNIVPREPFGSPTLTSEAMKATTITFVTLKLDVRGGVLTITPATDADAIIIAEWCERHKHTSKEEFDWMPFT